MHQKKLHTTQHGVNQDIMHQNAESSVHYSVTFATNVDMQQKMQIQKEWTKHWGLDYGSASCSQSCENNRKDLRNSPTTSGLPRPNRYNTTPQPGIPR